MPSADNGKKTIKQIISELDDLASKDPNFTYGIHPLYCKCSMQYHDGRRLKFNERVVHCYSGFIKRGLYEN